MTPKRKSTVVFGFTIHSTSASPFMASMMPPLSEGTEIGGPSGSVVVFGVDDAKTEIDRGFWVHHPQYVRLAVHGVHDAAVVRRYRERAAPVDVVQSSLEFAEARKEADLVVNVVVHPVRHVPVVGPPWVRQFEVIRSEEHTSE